MQSKDIKAGLVVAIGARPGDQYARRAIVLDGERKWTLTGSSWDRRSNRRPVKVGQALRDTGFAVAIENTLHLDAELRSVERPPVWRPDIAQSRNILAPWDEHVVQVEQARAQRADERERELDETRDRLAWHKNVEQRAGALGIKARGLWTERTVTFDGADVDRLLDLAEKGAAAEGGQ